MRKVYYIFVCGVVFFFFFFDGHKKNMVGSLFHCARRLCPLLRKFDNPNQNSIKKKPTEKGLRDVWEAMNVTQTTQISSLSCFP